MNRNMFDTEPGPISASTYLTSHQAAQLIQVNPSSINKWVKERRILAYRTPGGHRRILAADFVAFLTEYKMPVPAPLAGVQPAVAAPPPRAAAKKRAAKKTK
jgi:excisionase family DNA binding protein